MTSGKVYPSISRPEGHRLGMGQTAQSSAIVSILARRTFPECGDPRVVGSTRKQINLLTNQIHHHSHLYIPQLYHITVIPQLHDIIVIPELHDIIVITELHDIIVMLIIMDSHYSDIAKTDIC